MVGIIQNGHNGPQDFQLGQYGLKNPHQLSAWHEIIAEITPQEFYGIVTRNMPPRHPREKISLTELGKGFLVLDTSFYTDRGQHSHFRLKFDRVTTISSLHDADVYAHQGQGVATAFLNNARQLWKIFNTGYVTVTTKEIGSYAWLKLGFTPGNLGLRDSVFQRLETYSSQVSPAVMEFVHKTLAPVPGKEDEPKKLWAVADMETRVMDQNQTERKLAVELFRDLKWTGMLDLGDTASVERFESYTQKKLEAVRGK